MTTETLGAFEQLVLLALVRLGGSAYSAPLVLELEARGGQPVSAAKVYIALRRLERRGLVASRIQEASPGEGGRGRRTFRATSTAVEQLRQSRKTLERFWDGLDPALGRGR